MTEDAVLQTTGEDVVTERHPLVPSSHVKNAPPRAAEHVPMELDDISADTWQESYLPNVLPRAVQLHRLENIAVPACYLTVGLMQGMRNRKGKKTCGSLFSLFTIAWFNTLFQVSTGHFLMFIRLIWVPPKLSN